MSEGYAVWRGLERRHTELSSRNLIIWIERSTRSSQAVTSVSSIVIALADIDTAIKFEAKCAQQLFTPKYLAQYQYSTCLSTKASHSSCAFRRSCLLSLSAVCPPCARYVDGSVEWWTNQTTGRREQRMCTRSRRWRSSSTGSRLA